MLQEWKSLYPSFKKDQKSDFSEKGFKYRKFPIYEKAFQKLWHLSFFHSLQNLENTEKLLEKKNNHTF
jgi:hypothetical protein